MSTDVKKSQRFSPKLNTEQLSVTWADKVTKKTLTIRFADIAAKFQAPSRAWFICKGMQILVETRNSQVSADSKFTGDQKGLGFAATWKGVCKLGSTYRKPKQAKVPYSIEERAVAKALNYSNAYTRDQKENHYSAKQWAQVLKNETVIKMIATLKAEDAVKDEGGLDSLLS